jgi:hypothetical protein
MKTNTCSSHPANEAGSTLMVTVFVTGIIGFLLVAYMTFVQNQHTATARSQSWNATVPVIEAGIEEALAHLNANGLTGGNLASDGWAHSSGIYSVTRSIGDGTYTVRISNWTSGGSNNAPVIESFGYVALPVAVASVGGPLFFGAVGGGVTTTATGYLKRGVRVATKRDAIFAKGMVAKDSIDMNGNNIRADSFDSTNPIYSTNGLYIQSKARDKGDIAVNSSLTNSLNIGNADIYGHVSTGPGGVIAIGSQGAVGDMAWHAGNNSGIKGGWSSDDMNVSFPDVTAPTNVTTFTPSGGYYSVVSAVSPPVGLGNRIVRTNWTTTSTLPSGITGTVITNGNNVNNRTYTYRVYNYFMATNSANGTYYDAVLENGHYYTPSINGRILVLGDASLYVSDSLNVSSLVIEWSRHLDLYSGAPSVSITGNNTVNSDATADSFTFWGLPTCTSLSFGGNASFTGAIYAPNANFTLNGGGNNTIDFIGASITKTVRLNGHFNFHYDEALATLGPSRGFIVTSWNEIAPADVPNLAN